MEKMLMPRLMITEKQKQYLNRKGVISPVLLQKAYTESVKEQLQIKKAAEKIRAESSNK